jgi:magnesium transporter
MRPVHAPDGGSGRGQAAPVGGPAAGADSRIEAILFDADGSDHPVDLDAIDPSLLSDRQLLWIDVEAGVPGDEDGAGTGVDTALLARVARALGLGDEAERVLRDPGSSVDLQNFGDWFLAQVVAVEHEGQLRFAGRPLAIVCGENFVVTLHRGPIALIGRLRERERAETRIGSLRAEGFTASLLDWVVESYLHAVSDFEAAVDRLEVGLLASRVHREYLGDLATLRRGASRLRRMLAPHRHVFGALARPDFRPDDNGVANKQFRDLERRFERAMDAVENTRQLVVGTFELFTTRSAERTNDTMRVLTFVTVLLGSLAVVAGTLGMNFKTPFFETGDTGFWTSIALMLGFALAATAFARWRRWF